MGKKDKKSKTAEQKARVAAKQSKKAAQKEKKVKSKKADDSDAEDVDLESVLEEYAKKVGQAGFVFYFGGRKLLTFPASTIPQGHRGSMRASTTTYISNIYRLAFQCQRAFPVRRRVLQRHSRHVLQRFIHLQR